MLPEALSNDACSLVPEQDRLAVTVELEFEGATVRRTAFTRSTIRSDARLDYPRVDAHLRRRGGRRGTMVRRLAAAREVARPGRRARRRAARWRSRPSSLEYDFSPGARRGPQSGRDPASRPSRTG